MPALPLIVGNALYWCAENSRAGADRKLHHTGDLLAADGPDKLEKVSGMAHLTGFLVDVKPAAGALNPNHWSGLEP